MSLHDVLNEMLARFNEYSEDARIVLLHSHSRYRAAFISRLLSDPDLRVFYYALGNDDVDVRTFISGFTHEISEQKPTFGTHINQVGFDNLPNVLPLLQAFAADLNDLSPAPFLLILDEYDRAEVGDDLQYFLERLVDVMPDQCRLVMSGRGLPRLPWLAMIAQRQAVMLRDNEMVASDFYGNQAGDQARVVISALGPGTVILDGQSIETWEGHLPRLLFFFAMERPFITRSEICQAFWPELQHDQAVNVFHVTKRRLHKALEAIGVDILTHDGGYYRVNPIIRVHYDVIDFVGALVAGRTAQTPKARMDAYQRAIDLHTRPFLQGHTEQWIMARRHDYQTGFIEALTGMADVRLNEDRYEHALALLQRASTEDPFRQDLHRRIMTLFADLGRRSEAASHYQRLREFLANNESQMEAETEYLYRQLMES